jgi:hypothetical protein
MKRRTRTYDSDPNGVDYSLPGYSQPRCDVCGRFASRDRSGCWWFPCVSGDSIVGWEHK